MDERNESDGAPVPVDAIDLAPAGSDATGRRGWLGRGLVALVAVALVGGGIAVARDDSEPDGGDLQPLALAFGGAGAEAAMAADALYPATAIEYRLDGTLPDLGSSAPVYRLVQPAVSADDVAAMAAGLGVDGTAGLQSDGSWLVTDDAGSVSLSPMPGAWSVSYWPGGPVGDVVPGVTGGSTGVAEPGVAVEEMPELSDPGEPPITHTVPLPVEPPAGPTDLPTRDEAEAIARDALGATGVLDGADWEVTVDEGGTMGVAVACAPEADCSTTDVQETVLSWSVVFHRVVDGVTTTGLEWSVDVGDGGAIQGAYGTLTGFQAMGDYPLRSAQSAFDALVAGDVVYPGPVPLGAPDAMSSGASSGDMVYEATTSEDASLDDPDVGVASGGGAAGDAGAVDGTAADDALRADCEAAVAAGAGDLADCGTCIAAPADGQEVVCEPDVSTVTTLACPPGARCAYAEPYPEQPECDPAVVPDCPPPLPDPSVDTVVDDCGAGADCVILPACDGATTDCMPITTVPAVDEPLPEPEPIVVVVTGAERAAMTTWAVEDGAEVQYLVPTYRLLGHYADGGEWSTDVLAVDDSLVVDPSTPSTDPVPEEPPATEVPMTAPATDVLPPDSAPVPETVVPDPCDEEPGPDCPSVTTMTVPPPSTTVPPVQGGTAGGAEG